MKIRSLYFPGADDMANASWTREDCNVLQDEGNNVFTTNCCGDIVEYHFNEDFTTVYVKMCDYVSEPKEVRVTFED